MMQLIRKKLKKCYKEAGVNYMQDCREVRGWHQLPRVGACTVCCWHRTCRRGSR